jgi:hypothetical protein
MAENSTKSGALLSWAGGIVATVIASVAIYYFTRPAPVAPVTQVGLDGIVADDVSQKPISNALVTANLGSTLATQTTDSEGRYSFIMNTTTPPPPNQSISVNVLVGGYEHYTATVPLTSDETFAELPIQPIVDQAEQPGQPAAAAPITTRPRPVPILRIPKSYKRREDTAALKPKQK